MKGEALVVGAFGLEERGGEPAPVTETVEEILERYGPFLPYTWLFGQPAGTHDFPYWTNLLQKGVYGFEYWAERVDSALRMAMVGVEALMRTSSSHQVKFLALTPHAYGLPVRDTEYWLGIYYDGGDAGEKSQWTWAAGWRRVWEEYNRRRAQHYTGPEHWVVLLVDVNPNVLRRLSEEDKRNHRSNGALPPFVDWLENGPQYGMWPVIVDTYRKWTDWSPYRTKFRRFCMLGPWHEAHPEVALQLRSRLRDWQRFMRLGPDSALLLAGYEHMEVVLPESTWPWQGVLLGRDPRLVLEESEVQPVPVLTEKVGMGEPAPSPVSGD